MQDYNIRTAKAAIFDSFVEADQYIQNHSYPLVIKAKWFSKRKRSSYL